MISIEDALKAVITNSKEVSKEVILPIEKICNSILYKDIYAPINMPPFRQSAMDGYALNIHNDLSYNLIGEVKAGDCHNPSLNKGEAVRIFTGAAVPDSANAVVMQEKVERNDGYILINSEIQNSENIRPLGEQIKKNDLALKKNTKITASGIGFLQSLGITKIKVFQKPTIGIIVTGNELVEPGKKLLHGQIYESNGAMLQSALLSLGYTKINQYKTEDNYKKTLTKIENALRNNDLVLISGGISVGDYDFVKEALENNGVLEVFYKIKQNSYNRL